MTTRQSPRWLKIVLWSSVIGWMGMIFFLSQQVAPVSNQTSRTVAAKLVETLPQTKHESQQAKQKIVGKINHYVRKTAHALIYFVLAILVMLALRIAYVPWKQRGLWAVFICVLFAVTDEIHQTFIDGRACQLRDVGIDMTGVIFGIVLVGVVTIIFKVGKKVAKKLIKQRNK